MKFLFILLLLISCGKKDDNEALNVFKEELAEIPEMYVGYPLEARDTLRDAVKDGNLWQFHNTRWYLHQGVFLFKSVVLNDTTYKLVE